MKYHALFFDFLSSKGEINDEYVATLHKFDAQLDFVSQDVENVPIFVKIEFQEELHVTTSEVKAVKEVRNDLNILKSQCGARVRDYLLETIRKITPESNLEELQKSELLGTAEIMLFLKKHIPKTFEEVGKRGNWDVDQAAVRGFGEGNHDESRQILPRNVR